MNKDQKGLLGGLACVVVSGLVAVTALAAGCDSPRTPRAATSPVTTAPPAVGTGTTAREPNGAVEVLGYVFAAAGVALAGIGVFTLVKILSLLLSRKVSAAGDDAPAGDPAATLRPANLSHLWWVFLAGVGGGTVLIGLGVLLLR